MRGFDIFMQVAQRIYEKRKDVVFLCIGSDRVCYGGDMAQIQEESFRDHVLKNGKVDLDRFIFTGRVPPTELRRAFAFSDLHIYLTVPFILSWSLMDALACGCTVLVSDTPPLREVIEHGRNGLMAPYFDIDRFVELALQVLDDPAAYRRTLGQAGMATIRDRYDLDVVLPQMIALYERAIHAEAPAVRHAFSLPKQDDVYHLAAERVAVGNPVPPGRTDCQSVLRMAPNNGSRRIGLDDLREAYAWPEPLHVQAEVPSADEGWIGPTEETCLRAAMPKDAKLILELGAWRGQTTRFLAAQCPQATILAVDTWHGGRFREPEHPDWKAMLPEVWNSFVARVGRLRDRVIPVRQRHDDAVREVAASAVVPDIVYYDPDYNRRLVRDTLRLVAKSFPNTPMVGHDWLIRLPHGLLRRQHPHGGL